MQLKQRDKEDIWWRSVVTALGATLLGGDYSLPRMLHGFFLSGVFLDGAFYGVFGGLPLFVRRPFFVLCFCFFVSFVVFFGKHSRKGQAFGSNFILLCMAKTIGAYKNQEKV